MATALSRLADPGEFVALWAPNVAEWPLVEYGAAVAGVTLVALNPVLRGQELEYALEAMRRESATVLFYVPAVLGALLEGQQNSDDPAPTLTTVMGGASNVPPAMIEAAERVFGSHVVNLFGQTELAPVLTATRPGDTRADQLETVGHPLPQVDVRIVDPLTGEVVRLGEPGEICARGYQQMVEYLHDPEGTAATVDADGFVHTGDLGAMDDRGYIRLTGRLKELIIRKGENIAPAEIESCLVEHETVLDAAVFGIPDERSGEIVGAAVRVRGERPADLRETLAAHCRARLSPHKLPERWFVAAEFPLTPTQKVQKFRLVEQAVEGAFDEL